MASPYSRIYSSATVDDPSTIAADHLNAEFDIVFTAIGTGGITATELASNAVTADKIAANAVTFTKLAAAAVVTEAEGISSNDNDTTLPTSAAVIDYVDAWDPTIATGISGASDSEGYCNFPNGLQLRWGKTTATASTTTAVALATAFTTQCFQVAISLNLASGTTRDWVGVNTLSKTGFNLFNTDTNNSAVRWIAVGY